MRLLGHDRTAPRSNVDVVGSRTSRQTQRWSNQRSQHNNLPLAASSRPIRPSIWKRHYLSHTGQRGAGVPVSDQERSDRTGGGPVTLWCSGIGSGAKRPDGRGRPAEWPPSRASSEPKANDPEIRPSAPPPQRRSPHRDRSQARGPSSSTPTRSAPAWPGRTHTSSAYPA
jgi:hypothetical protein